MTPRVSKDPNKIKYVSLVNGRWVYRPYIPVGQRAGLVVDRGGFLRPIRLGSEQDPWHVIVTAHARAYEQLHQREDRDRLTLRWLSARYFESDQFAELALGTRKQAETLNSVLEHEMAAGVPTLGDAYPHEITKPTVRTIRTKRLAAQRARGFDGTVRVNREIQHVSSILSWAGEHYDEVTANPFKVRRLTERKRQRYVTHDEYFAQLAIATDVADYLFPILELTYQFAARGIETLDVKVDDIELVDEDGKPMVRVRRRKGSETTYIRRNERIDAAIEAAYELRRTRRVVGAYLIPGMRSARMNKSTLDDAMQRVHERMIELGMESRHSTKEGRADEATDMFWRLHDLKRKGISDAADNRIAGHKSDAIREGYDVKVRAFDAPR